MEFVRCVIYFAVLGVLAFPVGRIISKINPDPNKFPFKAYAWEQGGRIYEKLNIKAWQARIPDVSKVLGKWMPKKQLSGKLTAESVGVMIRETCVAETVHTMLNVAGLYVLKLWPGVGGILLYLVYNLLGNLPFIIVQRYNRPRLMKMRERLLKQAFRDRKPETR